MKCDLAAETPILLVAERVCVFSNRRALAYISRFTWKPQLPDMADERALSQDMQCTVYSAYSYSLLTTEPIEEARENAQTLPYICTQSTGLEESLLAALALLLTADEPCGAMLYCQACMVSESRSGHDDDGDDRARL